MKKTFCLLFCLSMIILVSSQTTENPIPAYPIIYDFKVTSTEPTTVYSSEQFMGNTGYRPGVVIDDFKTNPQWIVQYGNLYRDTDFEITMALSTKHESDFFLIDKTLLILKIKNLRNGPVEIDWNNIVITQDETQVELSGPTNKSSLIPPKSALSQSFSFSSTINQLYAFAVPREIKKEEMGDPNTSAEIEKNIGKSISFFIPYKFDNKDFYITLVYTISGYKILRSFPGI